MTVSMTRALGTGVAIALCAPLVLLAMALATAIVLITAPLTLYSIIMGKHLSDPFSGPWKKRNNPFPKISD
jgi:multisubunit Na+/H+ antiporter MnhG subunit